MFLGLVVGKWELDRNRIHHSVRPFGVLPVVDEGLLGLTDDAVRDDAIVTGWARRRLRSTRPPRRARGPAWVAE